MSGSPLRGEPVSPADIQGSLLNNSTAGAPVFSQYLKSKYYPVWKINVYPTGSNGVQILVMLVSAWGSDSLLTGCRWPFLMAVAVSRNIFEPLDRNRSRNDMHSCSIYCLTSRSGFGTFPSGGIGLLITLLV